MTIDALRSGFIEIVHACSGTISSSSSLAIVALSLVEWECGVECDIGDYSRGRMNKFPSPLHFMPDANWFYNIFYAKSNILSTSMCLLCHRQFDQCRKQNWTV